MKTDILTKRSYKCCCCSLWVGIVIIGVLTIFEFVPMFLYWLNCISDINTEPDTLCIINSYYSWIAHSILFASFMLLFVSKGNLASRKLLRNAFITETFIIVIALIVFAILWA